jgi:hypothetical protein
MLSLPRLVVLATVAACAVILSGMSVMGYERYDAVRGEAQASLQSSLDAGHDQLAAFVEQQSALALDVAAAEKLWGESAGKTLDESARDKLAAAIAAARTTLREQEQQGREFAIALDRAEQRQQNPSLWPPDELAAAKSLGVQATADSNALQEAVRSLGTTSTAVQGAQSAWQAEQERVAAAAAEAAAAEAAAATEKAAAEAAARLAAPRTITPVSTVTESGGSTAPSAPAPPSEPIAPVVGLDIEGYVAALAPNSYISWVDALCAGYYVCGRAWVGGVNSTPVKIELDPALRDIYANPIGISVLVHEAAHARQWLYYGADIISANEALTGLTGAPAVEYMADCATIGKLGYSTGTYTSSCTSDQLAAAALIW